MALLHPARLLKVSPSAGVSRRVERLQVGAQQLQVVRRPEWWRMQKVQEIMQVGDLRRNAHHLLVNQTHNFWLLPPLLVFGV